MDSQKALEAAMNDINSSFGKGSVTRLGSAGGALVETFPSGCLTLDLALGGGLPKRRIVEVFGPESSGKNLSTPCNSRLSVALQKLGGNAMLLYAEHAFDPAYSRALGWVWKTSLYANLIMAIRFWKVQGDEDIGLKVRVRVQKSKFSRPYKQAEFENIFGEGVSKLGCVLDCAELIDVVAKKGSWYCYEDHRSGQGKDKALQYLRENPPLCSGIEKVVRSVMA